MADSGDFSDKNGSHRVLKSNSTSDSLKATSPRSSSLDTSTDGGDMITLWEPPWSSDALVAVARFWEAWEAYVENVSNSDESVSLLLAVNMERSTGAICVITIERRASSEMGTWTDEHSRRVAFESSCGYHLKWRFVAKQRAHGKYAFSSLYEKVPDEEPAGCHLSPIYF